MTNLPTRVHLDTLEVRVYGTEEEITDTRTQDAVADAFNVALEQVKRDLAKVGLEAEADF